MPLEFKISNPLVSDTAKTIYLTDETGAYDAVNNPGGYGSPNQEVGDIDLYVIELSHLSLKEVYVQTQGRAGTPPEVIITPAINDIANGNADIALNTYRLKIDDSTELKTFGDGVYNIDVSVVFNDVYAGTGGAGNTYIVPAVPFVGDFDVVYAGGVIYDIDKSKDTNLGTVIYLVQELQDDISSFRVGYKDNVKLANDTSVKTCMTRKAIKTCGCGKSKRVIDVWVDYLNSQWAFDDEDYAAANDLILSAGATCKRDCGC